MRCRGSCRLALRWALALGVIACMPGALAQAAPDGRPIRILLGFASGGSLDAIARLMAGEMAKGLKRPVIVDNRPGADGNIAAEAVAHGPADGSVLLFTFNNHPFLKALYPDLSFDPIADFRAVALVASTPYVLVANPAVPGADLTSLLAAARASRRSLNFADIGIGSPQHLLGVRLQKLSGVDMAMLHYKGGAPAQTDVLAGHADMMLSTLSFAMPQLKAGRLKALAVTTAQRVGDLPAVPTLAESGFPGLIGEGWYGLLLPARAPDALAQRYNEEINRALAEPSVHDTLEHMGTPPLGGTTGRMQARMREEQRYWSRVVLDNAIRAE